MGRERVVASRSRWDWKLGGHKAYAAVQGSRAHSMEQIKEGENKQCIQEEEREGGGGHTRPQAHTAQHSQPTAYW